MFSLHVNIARNNLRDNITPELTTRKLSLHKHPVSQLDSERLESLSLATTCLLSWLDYTFYARMIWVYVMFSSISCNAVWQLWGIPWQSCGIISVYTWRVGEAETGGWCAVIAIMRRVMWYSHTESNNTTSLCHSCVTQQQHSQQQQSSVIFVHYKLCWARLAHTILSTSCIIILCIQCVCYI